MSTPEFTPPGAVDTKAMRQALQRMAPVTLILPPAEAFALLANLQLALRHPGNAGRAREVAEQTARGIQARIAPPGSPLAEVAEMGWREECDVPVETTGEAAPSARGAKRSGLWLFRTDELGRCVGAVELTYAQAEAFYGTKLATGEDETREEEEAIWQEVRDDRVTGPETCLRCKEEIPMDLLGSPIARWQQNGET